MAARRIGLDVHREFAQIAVWEDGLVRQAGQIATTPEALRVFAMSLERLRRLVFADSLTRRCSSACQTTTSAQTASSSA